MFRRLLLSAVVLAVSMSIGYDKVGGTTLDQAAPKAAAVGPKLDVYEALFRHWMKNIVDDKAKRKPIFYLSIEGEDPPPHFLDRFDKSVGVRPASKVKAKAPDEFAFMLSADRLELKGEDQARVLGNAYELNEKLKCGTPFPTLLKRQDRKWAVVEK